MIPKRRIPEKLICLLQDVETGTTIMELVAAYIISVLQKNEGSRTKTSEELKIPLRTFRTRIWQIESLGYTIPKPKIASKGRQDCQNEYIKIRKKHEL